MYATLFRASLRERISFLFRALSRFAPIDETAPAARMLFAFERSLALFPASCKLDIRSSSELYGLTELSSGITSPEMLIEVFSILLNNAIDSIKETARRGMLWLSTRLDSAGFIVVTVRDNGRGIRPENLNHIFEMGWSTREEGMGFGLFWLKDFVEGLGGAIMVDSKYQQGATFSIRLPVIQPETVTQVEV